MQARVDLVSPWPASQHGMSARLRAFIIISLAAHFLLLLAYSDKPVTRFDSQLGSKAIRISLSDMPAPTKQVQVTPPDIPRQHHNSNIAQNHQMSAQATWSSTARETVSATDTVFASSRAAAEAAQDLSSTTKENTEQSANTSTEISSKAQRNFLLGEIHNQLSRHLQYPLHARRRGWEGEVLLGFHINREGLLGNIHLARSSGYALLDRSAINALRKIKTIPFMQQSDSTLEAGFQPMDLQLPVIYQLHEG